MKIGFYALILITGTFSIYTDITQRKIKNKHLVIISIAAFVLYSIGLFTGKLNPSPSLFLNPVIGLITGFTLYAASLWKAGDAKLFFVFSLLLPTNQYSAILPFSCFVLFMNIFLMSFIFILPSFLKNIINNKEKIIKEVVSKTALRYFGQIFMITFAISWIIRPALSLLALENNLFLNFTLLYLGYLSIFRFINKIKSKVLVALMFAAGLILRVVIMPESFSLTHLASYIKYLLSFSLVFYILRIVMRLEETRQKRIPFAPFMFVGAILSNTDFLWWAIKVITYLRR